MPRFVTGTMLILMMCLASSVMADTKAEAKAAFMEGVEAFEKEDYPGALAAFERSYSLRPKAKVLYNIGMCQKALFRYADSLKTFERFLEEGGNKIKPRRKKEVKKAITDMQQMVGRLEFSEATPEAEVFINGKSVGKTPFEEPILVDPGQHAISVEKEEFEPLRTDITVASGALVSVRSALVPVPAEEPVVEPALETSDETDEELSSEQSEDDDHPGRSEEGPKYVGDGETDPGGFVAKKRRRGHVFLWSGVALAALGGVAHWQAAIHGQRAAEENQNIADEKQASRMAAGFMWAGYGLGTVMMTTGIIFLVSAKRERFENRISFSPVFDGENYALVLKGEW